MIQVARDDGSAPRTLNNFAFTRSEVRAVVRRLADADTLDKRRRLPGIDETRVDIILAGALILEETMQSLGIKRMILSENALREGALLDALSRQRDGAFHHLQDLRRRSVVHLMELMDDDPAHSVHVATLALELFDETAPWHELPERSRELLEAAALLANVGLFVSHSGHHKHSYYVIRNSDHLAGFTDHEIELVALVARYHRKSAPKPKHPEFAALRPADQELVRSLASILRVAIALDRTHAALVRAVGARPEGKAVVLEVSGDPGADLSLEVFTATERKGLLEEVLGRPVRIEEAASA